MTTAIQLDMSKSLTLQIPVLIIITIFVIIIASSQGAVGQINLWELYQSEGFNNHVIQLRLPRVLLSFIIGAGLALSGVILQTFFRNDLCCPYTLGVSSFASLGAIFAIYLNMPNEAVKIFAAFAALLSLSVLLLILFGKYLRDTSTVLLIGISFGLISSSFIGFFQHLGGPEKIFAMSKWLEGGIEIIGFTELQFPLIALIMVIGCFFHSARELDLIQVSFDFARGRGVNIEKTAFWLIFPCAIFIGVITAVCGPIGFVGLVVPHVVKHFTGGMHSKLLLLSMFVGGWFVVLMDLISRTVIAPAELPIGILSGLVGTPFFLVLLFRRYFRFGGGK